MTPLIRNFNKYLKHIWVDKETITSSFLKEIDKFNTIQARAKIIQKIDKNIQYSMSKCEF